MSFNELLRSAQGGVSRNAPAILTGLGITGLLGTVVLAVAVTPQAHIDIQNAESEQTDPLTVLEKVKLTWKYYIPAGAVGAASVAALIGAQSVNSRRQAALVSAYTMSERMFREYRTKVTEEIGEKKEAAIQDKVAESRLVDSPPESGNIFVTGHGDYLCHDSLSGRYFTSTSTKVQEAVNEIQIRCINDMYASLNDFYTLLGIPPTPMGEDLGWTTDTKLSVYYSTHMSPDQVPVLSIEYRSLPITNYFKVNR